MEAPAIRVLFQSDSIIIGQFCCSAAHPQFNLAGCTSVRPSISLPRVPIQFRFGSASVVGDPATAVMFDFGQVYRRSAIVPAGSVTDWIEINPDILREIMLPLDSRADERAAAEGRFPFKTARVPAPAYLPWRARLAQLAPGGVVDPLHRLAIEEAALGIAFDVLAAEYSARHPARPRVEGGGRGRASADIAEHVRVILGQCFRESPTLGEIARRVGLSVFHLCRVFRLQTGSTIHEYVDRLRVRSAADALLTTERSCLRIALEAGYATEPHFSERFVREFGVRPGRFRRMARLGLFPKAR